MPDKEGQELKKQCCGDCAHCDSPYRLQSMVCSAQLSLYSMRMLEQLTAAVDTLRSDVAMLTQALAGGKAIEPAKPAKVSNEEAQEGSGAE